MPDESFFAKLENKSLKEQHQFMAKYTFESVPVLPKKRNVEVGDHLRLEGAGKSYTHHAVCTKIHGENITVAEYTGPIWSRSGISQSTSCSDSGRLAEIIKTTLSYYDLIKRKAEIIVWPEDLRRFPPEKIVERAYQRLGENFYNLTKNNCEHFVTWCTCGLRVSLQVKSWHVALVETLGSMMNTKTAGLVIANVADEIVPFLREYSNWLLLLDVFIELGIGVYELYKLYEEYKGGGEYQGKHEEIVKKVFLIILKGVIRFGLVYFGLNYGEKIINYFCGPLGLSFPTWLSTISDKLGGFIKAGISYLPSLSYSDTMGWLPEAGIGVYELKKAWDQWGEGILIRSGWEFGVKVIDILTKGAFRFILGYLGSMKSGEIFSKIGEYLHTLSKLNQSLVCGAVGGCLGHLAGVVITWIVENFGDIINSG